MIRRRMTEVLMHDADMHDVEFALAFETSSATGEVALARGAEVVEAIRFEKARAHASAFVPAVDMICRRWKIAPQQIRLIYVSEGPGSFTGLRIGVTAAKMLALAHGARIVAVPTLEVIAQNALDASDPPEEVAVLLDAKRGHVYAAAFRRDAGGFVAVTEPAEVDPRAFLESRSPECQSLGEGVLYHRDAVRASGRRMLDGSLYPPRASTVARLGYARRCRGEFVDRRLFAPIYIRPPEAEEKWARRQAPDAP